MHSNISKHNRALFHRSLSSVRLYIREEATFLAALRLVLLFQLGHALLVVGLFFLLVLFLHVCAQLPVHLESTLVFHDLLAHLFLVPLEVSVHALQLSEQVRLGLSLGLELGQLLLALRLLSLAQLVTLRPQASFPLFHFRFVGSAALLLFCFFDSLLSGLTFGSGNLGHAHALKLVLHLFFLLPECLCHHIFFTNIGQIACKLLLLEEVGDDLEGALALLHNWR